MFANLVIRSCGGWKKNLATVDRWFFPLFMVSTILLVVQDFATIRSMTLKRRHVLFIKEHWCTQNLTKEFLGSTMKFTGAEITQEHVHSRQVSYVTGLLNDIQLTY